MYAHLVSLPRPHAANGMFCMHLQLLLLGQCLGVVGVEGSHVLVQAFSASKALACALAQIAYKILAFSTVMLLLTMLALTTTTTFETLNFLLPVRAKGTAATFAANLLVVAVVTNATATALAANVP